MNILIVGKFSAEHFGFHIADTLNAMDHTTVNFEPTIKEKYPKNRFSRRVHQSRHFLDSALINLASYRERRKRKLKKIFKNQAIDLTLCTHDFLYPDEIQIIKEGTKAPIALWFPDPIANFGKAFFLISSYDILFFKDPYIVRMLRDQYNKKNVFYLPECCNPRYHKSIMLSTKDIEKYSCDITTYGSPHNIRSSFFRQLIGFNYSIKIWGHQAPIWLTDKKIKALYTGEYVFNESKAKSVLCTKINLNTLLPSEIVGLNARAFEIAGIGGFQVIHWRPGLDQLFEDGKELVSFKYFSELKEILDYYLNNDSKRKMIAAEGQKRAYKDHTYQLRIKLLLDTIYGKGMGYLTDLIN